MTSRDFCYWLQGYFELSLAQSATGGRLEPRQVEQIKNHLALVFIHEIDPANAQVVTPATAQAVHDGEPLQIGGVGPNGEIYRC